MPSASKIALALALAAPDVPLAPLLAMLLVQHAQHPTSPALMAPKLANVHRRNPSAPAAVVQVHPTKTPGLLSLSKPQARPQH